MTQENRRRKRLIIDRKLQMGVSLHLVGYVYLYLVLFALLANFNALKHVIFGGDGEEYVQAVARLHVFLETFVLPMIFTFVCLLLHGFIFTHKIAGPIYRFRETMRKLKGGDLADDIELRENDYFRDLCVEVNGMIGHLRNDLLAFKRASVLLADEGESLAQTGDLPPEAQKKLLSITNASTELRQLVESYRLEDDVETPKDPAWSEPQPEPQEA